MAKPFEAHLVEASKATLPLILRGADARLEFLSRRDNRRDRRARRAL